MGGGMRDRRITKRLVDSLKPIGADHFVWDDTLIGFGVRVQPTGAKSYIVKYRAGSGRGAPTRRVTLGRVGRLTPDEARALARKTLGAVAHGSDPAALRAAERRASTLRELADIFLAEHVEAKRKRSTATHYRSLLEKVVLPALGSRKAEQVTTSDLAKLHAQMRARPYQANRMLEVVGSLYSFAGKRKILPLGFNPARGIDQYVEKGRERYLSGDELSRLGDAVREAETVGLPYEIDDTKPTAKHAPKEANRRTKIGPHAAAAIRLLVCRERSIVRGDEDRIMIRPSSRSEARSLLGCQTVNELGAPVASSRPAQLPGHEPASARMGYEDGYALVLRYRRVEGPLGCGGAA